jgi:hypothetical protein
MAVQTYTGELMGTFPRLPYLHALQLINRAWTRVRDLRLWSWQLVVDAQLYAPAIITAGTVTVTQFSTSITVNSAAATALNAGGSFPPVASATLGIGRQIRVGLATGLIPANGSIYNIVAWDGTSTLTIDKPFAEGSATLAPYQVYKVYYAPPASPFSGIPNADTNAIRPVSMTNKSAGYAISGRRLNYTQEQLNRMDPTRGASDGSARIIAPYQTNATGQPTWELYPAPTQAAVYGVTYYHRWPDLSASVDFPQVPYGLATMTLDLARSFACQWAMANVATAPELAQTNWVAAASGYRQDYVDGLKMCLKQDDEIMPAVPFFQGRRAIDFPLGGQYLQNHDITGLLS